MSSACLPPAQPAFILRGHSAQIHALHFTKNNARLLTADADGWIVSWNLAFKRPVVVWKAHGNAVLGVGSWGTDRIITHGRDDRLLVWKLGIEDESTLDKTLPVDAVEASNKLPWLLHMLTVNTLNFCPFAMCRDGMPQVVSTQKVLKNNNMPEPILIAVPNTIDSGGIDIYQLPTQTRAANIGADRDITTGMVMALSILADSTRIQVAAGYESGHTMVFVQNDPAAAFQKLYSARPHTQPVLSLSIAPSKDTYITTSADANIAKHPFPSGKSIWNTELKTIKVTPTKHSGQQGLSYRSDGKVFATAGWDSHVRVYSGKTMKELAGLKWHKEGSYATAFAAIKPVTTNVTSEQASEGQNGRSAISYSDQASEEETEALVKMEEQSSAVGTIQRRRDEKARNTHWLAAGAKDGKVSLWDIY